MTRGSVSRAPPHQTPPAFLNLNGLLYESIYRVKYFTYQSERSKHSCSLRIGETNVDRSEPALIEA